MSAISHENAATLSSSLESTLPLEGRTRVAFVSTDDPSPALLDSLRQVLPNIQTLCLDGTHLAMVYEYATW